MFLPVNEVFYSVLRDNSTGEVVGFQTFVFQDDGKIVLQQGIRVDPSVRGKGLGSILASLGFEYTVYLLIFQGI